MQEPTSDQFHTFKDCLARRILSWHPDATNSSEGSSGLDDFASYLASESWPTLPPVLQIASFDTRSAMPELETLSLDATSASFVDTLISYGMCLDYDAALVFLRKTIEDYIHEACAPPPVWSTTRTQECEICEREVRLTYHHLIPRSTHSKVLKKKWHSKAMLNSVAWLCRSVNVELHNHNNIQLLQ